MNIKILVCCHKEDIYLSIPPYMPIHVGKEKSSIELGIPGDNTGDNISTKNNSYCELTGMYWAWKNLKGLDAIGLCHYRRYFDFHKQCPSYLPYGNFKVEYFEKIDFNLTDKISKYIEKGYVIVPSKIILGTTLEVQYCLIHDSKDLRTLENVIKDHCNDRYADAFYHVIHGNNKLHPFNMFIMPWDVFDRYCQWLFPILKAVELKTDTHSYDPYQQRLFGFMAERLFNVFLYAERIRTKDFPVICINESSLERGRLKTYAINIIKNMNVFIYKLLYYYNTSL